MGEKTVEFTEKGLSRIREILGDGAEVIIDTFQDVSPDFTKLIVDFAYGELHARKGLSDKSKELAVVSSLVTQGRTGLPLKAHIQGMLNVGWSKEEIIELFIFLTGYVGFPSTVDAFKTLKEVLSED